MQQQLFLLIILLEWLMIKSQNFPDSYERINLEFYYSRRKPYGTTKIYVATRPVLKINVDNAYIFIGDPIDDRKFIIRAFNCTNFRCSCGQCNWNFESSYIFLQNIMLTEDYVLKIENKNPSFQYLLRELSSKISWNKNDFNLTCILVDTNYNYFENPKDPYRYPLSKTSLFGIIFLSACIVLVFILCFGWFALIYYRRCTQYRMKKKLRKELMQSTQQMLEKSPVIIYDADNKDNDHTDDDPMCAICLESFKTKEKIRKLVCSHYFHITCIDPWLLSRQSCPLCNRNILRNSIPSISSSIMAAINEHNNEESITIPNNDNNNNQTVQSQNRNV